MIKITVFWNDAEKEIYEFDNEDDARMFCSDALSKCGSVIYSWEKTKEDKVQKLIDKIELILILEGQHDLQFKLGEIIKYDPHAVKEILLKHKMELDQIMKE